MPPVRNSNPSLPKISPRAARTAQQFHIDWSTITGSGRGGRIRERDILALVPSTLPAEPQPDAPGVLHPASGTRRTIAKRMLESVRQTAAVTLTTKVDASELATFRERLRSAATDVVPSYNDMLVRLVAGCLADFPQLNVVWHNDGIYVFDEVNIAVAVNTDAGLMVPVLNNADRLSLSEISVKTLELAQMARAGRLRGPQLSGGTFTVTNLGAFGIDLFTPIINRPQSAILGIGRIISEPVIRENEIVAGKTLSLSLTFDHQVIDGAPAAEWLQQLSARIVAPEPYL
ncbi:MAG: dihydrolipoamide acetyltransferase family protein [Planctomycetaceae bacterium]